MDSAASVQNRSELTAQQFATTLQQVAGPEPKPLQWTMALTMAVVSRAIACLTDQQAVSIVRRRQSTWNVYNNFSTRAYKATAAAAAAAAAAPALTHPRGDRLSMARQLQSRELVPTPATVVQERRRGAFRSGVPIAHDVLILHISRSNSVS